MNELRWYTIFLLLFNKQNWKKKKKVMAIFISFEEYILKELNFRNYLKVNKVGSHKEYYS